MHIGDDNTVDTVVTVSSTTQFKLIVQWPAGRSMPQVVTCGSGDRSSRPVVNTGGLRFSGTSVSFKSLSTAGASPHGTYHAAGRRLNSERSTFLKR